MAGPGCQEGDTVTAPALGATCEARPSSGPGPLTVAFLLSVSGAEGPFIVAISYGDGTSGTNPDAPHTYAVGGAFTVSFTVTTATQSARCSTTVTAQPGTPPSPPPSSNQPPTPVFKSTPDAAGSTISGTAPLAVRFNMCASTDPERDRLYYLMDFDGDGRIDWAGRRAPIAGPTTCTRPAPGRRATVSTTSTRTARPCTTISARSYSVVVTP